MDERWRLRLRALNRFGLGARPEEAARLGEPRDWLMAQLAELRAGAVTLAGPALAEIARLLRALRQDRVRNARNRDAERAAAREVRELVLREAHAALRLRLRTESPFLERLVAFWSNHLCVSTTAGPHVAALAGHYERTVIRPHVLARYEDMLLASARHPAMLLYLDNARSTGPHSRIARGGQRGRGPAQRGPRGFNENYARELLELHTVGIKGGYTQRDVEELALALTGWTVDAGIGSRGSVQALYGFRFVPDLHEPGAKTVMGVRYPEGGEDEGKAVLRTLARHGSTARFLGEKLARHFVADDPPEEAVERLARVFHDTEGDLLEVSRALVDLEAAWQPEHRKLRGPHDWLMAALRALEASEPPPAVLQVLAALRQPLWGPPSPKGYDDLARVWADPDGLMNRAEAARSLARRRGRSLPVPERLGALVEGGDAVMESVLRDLSIAPDERVALALAGPAFQWR